MNPNDKLEIESLLEQVRKQGYESVEDFWNNRPGSGFSSGLSTTGKFAPQQPEVSTH